MSGKGNQPKSKLANPARALGDGQCMQQTEEDNAVIELLSKTKFFDKRQKYHQGLNTTLYSNTIRFEGPPESVEEAVQAMKFQKMLVTTRYRAVDNPVAVFLEKPEVIREINSILEKNRILCTWKSNGEGCILTHALKKEVAKKAGDVIFASIKRLNLSPDIVERPAMKRFITQEQHKLYVKKSPTSNKVLVIMTSNTYCQNSKLFDAESSTAVKQNIAEETIREIPDEFKLGKKNQLVVDNITILKKWKARYLEVFNTEKSKLLAETDMRDANLEIKKELETVCLRTDQTITTTMKLPVSFKDKCEKLETKIKCMISVSKEAYFYSGWLSSKERFNIFTLVGPSETHSVDVLVCPVRTCLSVAFEGWEDVIFIGDIDVQVGCETYMRKLNGRIKPHNIVTLYTTGDLGCHALCLVPLEDIVVIKDKDMTFIVQQLVQLLNMESFRSIGVSIGNDDSRYGSFIDLFVRKLWKFKNELKNNTSLYIFGDSPYRLDEIRDSVIMKNKMDVNRVPVAFEKMSFISGMNTQHPSVNIVIGSILDQQSEVDVIVNSTNCELRLDAGGVSKKLVQAGGASVIMRDCKEKYPEGIGFGELAVTVAGNLKCKSLFHGALPERITHGNILFEIVKVFVYKCLAEAERRNFKSIAFPALGTGILAYPTCMVAKAMFDGVCEFWETNYPSTLKTVQFVLFQDERHTVEIFQNVQKWAESVRKFTPSSNDIPPQHMLNINKSRDVRFLLAENETWEMLRHREVRIDVHKVSKESEIRVSRLYWNNTVGCYMIDVQINETTKNLQNCFSKVIGIVEDYRFKTADIFLPSVTDLGISAQKQINLVMESVVQNADNIWQKYKGNSYVTVVRIFLHEKDYLEMARSFSNNEHEKEIDEASEWFVSNGYSTYSKFHIEVIGEEENAVEVIKTLKKELNSLQDNGVPFEQDITVTKIRMDAIEQARSVLNTLTAGLVQLDEETGNVLIKGTDEQNKQILSSLSKYTVLNIGNTADDTTLSSSYSTLDTSFGSYYSDTTDMSCVSYVTNVQGTSIYAPESLLAAAEKGQMDLIVKILTENLAMVNQAVNGKTALMMACCNGHLDVVEFLIKNKADIHQQDFDGDDALHFAVHSTDSDIIGVLLSSGVDMNAVNKKDQSALLIAVNKALPQCCRVLVNSGCNPNLKDIQGDTAMHDAISTYDPANNVLEIVLDSKNARFTTENAKGFNVLQWAVLNGSKIAVEVICSCDTSCVNTKMRVGGSTALHIAAVNNKTEIASVLLTKGKADINARDNSRRTPLMLAITSGRRQMIDLLIGHDCDINLEDNKGNTALHVAQAKKELSGVGEIRRCDAQVICTLIEKGADVLMKNKNGHTPVDLAYDESAKIYMKRLADKIAEQKCAKTALGLPLPPYWSEMNDQHNVTFLIEKSQGGFLKMEWESIEEKLKKTLPLCQILTIERIQNKYLWEMYYLTRGLLEKKYGKELHNELILFHGTDPDNVEYIKEENLDPRLAGQKTGALLGKGTYFAVEAKHSDRFAKPDNNGHKYMLLVKVLAGKPCKGKPKYIRPPRQDPDNQRSPPFDSCFDNEKNPKMYCIFDSRQYYPEYIIKYAEKQADSD